jgi:hypothetical protein
MPWLLLIYTVPSDPSRLRATVWRELKKAGAVYLRDGVAVLPDRTETRRAFRVIATQIGELGGQPTLIEEASLAAEREAAITAQANANREEEYAEVMRDAERFLEHARQEREHRQLTFAELEEIEADLGKLKRWVEQVERRDHFGAPTGDRVRTLLDQCEAELALFLEEAYAQTAEDGA